MNAAIRLRRVLRTIYRSLPIRLTWLRNLYFKFGAAADPKKVVVKNIGGIVFELHLREFIDSEIYNYGCFEEHTTRAIERIVRPGMIVLDIGANVGAHALPMARLVGAHGRVIAFEPMQAAQVRLQRNLELNEFTNISVEKIALSNRHEVAAAAFRTSWDKYAQEAEIPLEKGIQFETLDSYLVNGTVPRVDFIKIDVDGFEYKVLEGAKESLNRFRPTLAMELGQYTLEKCGDNLASLVALLHSLGYQILRERDFAVLPTLSAILKEFPDPRSWTINAIIVHESKTAAGVAPREGA